MDEARKQQYLKDSSRCPQCGDWYIEGDSILVDNGTVTQQMRCNAEHCLHRWTDVYQLVDVIDHAETP